MKTLFKLLGVMLLSATVLFTACGNEEPGENEVAKPSSLNRTVTDYKVVFTWSGNADSYILKVNDDEYPTTDVSYTLNDLALGSYTWSVRAVKGGEQSEWANGESFEIKNDEIDPSLSKVTNLGSEKVAANFAIVKFKRITDITEYEVEMAGERVTVVHREESTDSYLYCYSPVKLDAGKEYTWRVRYKKDEKYSEWAEEKFTTLASSSNSWWIKVTFEGTNIKEYWETGSSEGQIIGTNDPDEEPLVLYDAATGYMVGHYQSAAGKPKQESISPYRLIQFGMPCKEADKGTHDVDADKIFVNYCESSTLTYNVHDIQKMGNWFSTQDRGTFTLSKTELATGQNGAQAYLVTGSYDVTTFDSKAFYGDQTTIYGKLKVEFSGVPVMVN